MTVGGFKLRRPARHHTCPPRPAAQTQRTTPHEGLTQNGLRTCHNEAKARRSKAMSIFGNIMSGIVKSANPAGATPSGAAAPSAAAAAPLAQVDVEAVLTKLAEK